MLLSEGRLSGTWIIIIIIDGLVTCSMHTSGSDGPLSLVRQGPAAPGRPS
jgi:hypothetical protein